METRNRHIKKLNYYLILGFTIFQLLFILSMIIICIVYNYSNIFVHLTNWSYLFCLFYLISISIYDTNLYFFSSKKLENFHYFIRNKFSIISFPYTLMITFGFWVILLFGLIIQSDTFVKSGTKITAFGIFVNANIHLDICIMMIVELFLNEREEIKFNLKSIIPCTIVYIIYGIVVSISKYVFNHNAYIFMENLNIGGMIIVGIILYGLLIGSIYLYIVLSNWINRKKIEEVNILKFESINKENPEIGII